MSYSRVFKSSCLASPGPNPEQTTQRPITRAYEEEYRPKRRAKAIGKLKSHGTAAALGEPVTILSRLGVVASLYCCVGLLPARLGFASMLQLSHARNGRGCTSSVP